MICQQRVGRFLIPSMKLTRRVIVQVLDKTAAQYYRLQEYFWGSVCILKIYAYQGDFCRPSPAIKTNNEQLTNRANYDKVTYTDDNFVAS